MAKRETKSKPRSRKTWRWHDERAGSVECLKCGNIVSPPADFKRFTCPHCASPTGRA